MRSVLPIVCSFFLFPPLFAQVPLPESAWIGTGRVSAKITANGALVTDFLVPNTDGDGDSLISTVKEIAVWMGGLDPAGNLHLAIQRSDSASSDLRGGFRGIPGSAGVWKVTKAEIDQHIQDFEEDGDIDVMIPSIFSWPGRGNPFSEQLNGFAIDSIPWRFVPFSDSPFDFNTWYEPHLGEYPSFGYVINNIQRVPSEIVYVPFHTKSEYFKVNGAALFYAYDCDDATFLEDAVFGYLILDYQSEERLDSAFLSFYVNADIGNPEDDYIGSITGHSMAYFYNADPVDEGGFENSPPVFGFQSSGGFLDTFGIPAWLYSIMPVHGAGNNVLPGMTEPQLPLEYYRYMTGSWRDGSPLKSGGNGYWMDGQQTFLAFPGLTGAANGWSEVGAANNPGDRRLVISNGPATLKPKSAISFPEFTLNNISGTAITDQVQTLKQYSFTQGTFLYSDFFPPDPTPFDSIACLNTTTVKEILTLPAVIFPNPARDQVTIRAETPGLRQVVLYDLLGRSVVQRLDLPADSPEVVLPVGHLPAGMYILTWTGSDGHRGSGKVAVRH